MSRHGNCEGIETSWPKGERESGGRRGRQHGGGARSPSRGGPYFGDDTGGGSGFGRGAGPRGGGGRGGHRRKRVFDQGELQVLLLALLAEAPRHGYDLIREIESLSAGEYAPSPGIVYPALTYMEEAELIAVEPDQTARKAYGVTEKGREQVGRDEARADELRGRLRALAQRRDQTDPAPVRRAVQALRTAIHNRLSQAEANEELVFAIADALDEATRKIERIKPHDD
ncbi:PadR family transcriptional regulator [Novosphingobium sp. YJ-S2-02]|uniref:PadR family transcriptional regulator n=1 Tax=Novosphingobium aureum TaxID=2792964 RepID=A0A931HCG6_9SPHN|nr:PadR family transcriptional regulator [Novosphingobium aureum]